MPLFLAWDMLRHTSPIHSITAIKHQLAIHNNKDIEDVFSDGCWVPDATPGPSREGLGGVTPHGKALWQLLPFWGKSCVFCKAVERFYASLLKCAVIYAAEWKGGLVF